MCMYVYVCVCVYIYIYTYKYLYIYIYRYIQRQRKSFIETIMKYPNKVFFSYTFFADAKSPEPGSSAAPAGKATSSPTLAPFTAHQVHGRRVLGFRG